MSQVKAMKDALDLAYTTVKQNKSSLKKAVEKANISTRTLQTKLNTFKESIAELNAAHTSWVSKSEFSEEDLAQQTCSNAWLEAIWEEADDLIDKATEILDTAADTFKEPLLQTSQKVLILQDQMEALRVTITNKLNVIEKEVVSVSLSTASHSNCTKLLDDVNTQLYEKFPELSKSIIELSGRDLEKVIEEHRTFHSAEEKRSLDFQVKLSTLTPIVPVSSQQMSQTTSTTVSRTRVKMEDSKAPTFNGDAIDYPDFKRGWLKVAATCWDEDNQIEQMKYKVDAHTKMIISRCQSMSEVWDALDHEYGNEQEVVNSVNIKLKTLISSPSSTEQLILDLHAFFFISNAFFWSRLRCCLTKLKFSENWPYPT